MKYVVNNVQSLDEEWSLCVCIQIETHSCALMISKIKQTGCEFGSKCKKYERIDISEGIRLVWLILMVVASLVRFLLCVAQGFHVLQSEHFVRKQ